MHKLCTSIYCTKILLPKHSTDCLTMRSGLPESIPSGAAATEDIPDSIQAEAINSYLEVEERLVGQKRAKTENQDTEMSGLAPFVTPTACKSIAGLPVGDVASSNDTVEKKETVSPESEPASSRCGRWSLDEKLIFLFCLSLFGKGRWKKIHAYLPNR